MGTEEVLFKILLIKVHLVVVVRLNSNKNEIDQQAECDTALATERMEMLPELEVTPHLRMNILFGEEKGIILS